MQGVEGQERSRHAVGTSHPYGWLTSVYCRAAHVHYPSALLLEILPGEVQLDHKHLLCDKTWRKRQLGRSFGGRGRLMLDRCFQTTWWSSEGCGAAKRKVVTKGAHEPPWPMSSFAG